MTQGIYRIDPADYPALIATVLTGEIPAEILMCMPEWCIYVETPGLTIQPPGGTTQTGEAALRGAFVRVDADGAGERRLTHPARCAGRNDADCRNHSAQGDDRRSNRAGTGAVARADA
ncbi:hypothetical protein [Paraburkholderia bannensis]|uniref:hypothetical protein n=1 Tax=Paraburkholderia bannensis TaxID=765414 RepID=UPI002ABE5B43|nr:hypothetical protein [Paraburkholderia bannensis]